ncbi:hypothetical protein BRADI_2g59332v3 [Brachypodium distachyon]|uniref:Uncharacterized protein n=1 Tax=Brachypodium distachyon TaxID=15368 RepID=A0A2K2DGV4_BRADI|nr:hypothetical protein BRADI_2g59332v3 [Brachypodium distachyon]
MDSWSKTWPRTMPDIIQAILLEFILAILWMLWKSRNNLLFNYKEQNPLQVIHGANAILQTKDKNNQVETTQDLDQSALQIYYSVVLFESERIKQGPKKNLCMLD